MPGFWSGVKARDLQPIDRYRTVVGSGPSR
jgi:hypothetical protein